jgi:CheY-like chemotaxis protein
MPSNILDRKVSSDQRADFVENFEQKHFQSLESGIIKLKNFTSKIASSIHAIDLATLESISKTIDKEITCIKTIKVDCMRQSLLEFTKCITQQSEISLTIEIAQSHLSVDCGIYSQFLHIIQYIIERLGLNEFHQTGDIRILVSFFSECDYICMAVDLDTEQKFKDTHFKEYMIRICNSMHIDIEYSNQDSIAILFKAQHKPYYTQVLIIETGYIKLAIKQEQVISVITSDIRDNKVLMLQGENVPIINMQDAMHLNVESNNKHNLNFADLFNTDSNICKSAQIVLIKIGNAKYGLIIDEVIEAGEFKLYPNHALFKDLGYYIGSIEDQNHNLILAIDPVALIHMHNKSNQIKGEATSVKTVQSIESMIHYLIDFEDKIQKISAISQIDTKDVLVLEDSPLFRKLIVQKLEDYASNVFAFDDSSLALEYLKQNTHINIIVADFNIADIDGVLFAKKCKALRSSIKIISLISGIDAAELKNQKLDYLFYSFLSKNDQDKIAKVVNEILINEIEANAL